MPTKAVLTGDLINSQAARNTVAYLKAMDAVLKALKLPFKLKAETFRGDGFQAVPARPEDAIRCAVALRAGLIAISPAKERWDARISIGIGAAETRQHYGEAFLLSGQGLDELKRSNMAFFCNNQELLARLSLATEFASAIIDKWTVVEAQTYYAHLVYGLDQQSTAEALKKSRITVNKALQRAQGRLMDRYLEESQEWIMELIDA